MQILSTSYTNHFLHVPYSHDFSKEYHKQILLTKVAIDFPVCITHMCTFISKLHPNFLHKCHNSIILSVFTPNEISKKIALRFFPQIPQLNFPNYMQSKSKLHTNYCHKSHKSNYHSCILFIWFCKGK